MTDTDVKTREQADELLARSLVYRFLAQAFSYPTRVSLEQLRGEDLELAAPAAAPLSEPVREALAAAGAALEGLDSEATESAYRDLFSHIHSVDCPQYETDYTARDVWRQSNELADLAGFYRAFGLQEHTERQDHVATELEFMHLVTYKAAWATAQEDPDNARVCNEAAESFMRDHLLRWSVGLSDRVHVRAATPYRELAALASAFLRDECDRLGFVPEGLEPIARDEEEPGLCE
jgi:TorA maturation chaperone TorD